MEAYQTIKDETCPSCGNPIWLCRSTSNEFRFKVKSGVCAASRALESYKNSKKNPKDRVKDSKDKADWGKFFYTVPELLPFGEKLPTREDFFREKAGLVD